MSFASALRATACALVGAGLVSLAYGQTDGTIADPQAGSSTERARAALLIVALKQVMATRVATAVGSRVDSALGEFRRSVAARRTELGVAGAASALAAAAGSAGTPLRPHGGESAAASAPSEDMVGTASVAGARPTGWFKGDPQDQAVSGVAITLSRLDEAGNAVEFVAPQPQMPPRFASGERFAIHYTSTLPGVVNITNVDALGKSFYLGTFLVEQGVSMRFPPDVTKGMILDDTVGLETYRLEFLPCLPQPWVQARPEEAAALAVQVPHCGATEQQAGQVLARAKQNMAPRGTLNETMKGSPGVGSLFIAAAPFKPGEVVVTTFHIQHVAAPAAVPVRP